MQWFSTFSDEELKYWITQYSGDQAGFYPGLRRMRMAAEREAVRRGILRENVTPYRLALLRQRLCQ
ncbi:MAG: hypothetical protein AB1330_01465 [Bacillota bacterium]